MSEPNVREFAAALKKAITALERGTEAEASANCLDVWEHAHWWVSEKLYAARPALARAALKRLGAKPVVYVGGPAWEVIDRLKQLHKLLASARGRRRPPTTEERIIRLLDGRTQPSTAEAIGRELHLSIQRVLNVANGLVQEGRLRSIRGRNGGYLPV